MKEPNETFTLSLTNPVNAVSIPPEVEEGFLPYRELCYRLGVLHAQLLEGNPRRVRASYYGDLFQPKIRSYLTAIALCGFLKNRSAWEGYTRTWVTYDKSDVRSLLADEHVVYAAGPGTRNLPNLVRNLHDVPGALRANAHCHGDGVHR